MPAAENGLVEVDDRVVPLIIPLLRLIPGVAPRRTPKTSAASAEEGLEDVEGVGILRTSAAHAAHASLQPLLPVSVPKNEIQLPHLQMYDLD